MKLENIGGLRIEEADQQNGKYYLTVRAIHTNAFSLPGVQSLTIEVPEKVYRYAMGLILQGCPNPEIGLYLEDE